MNALCNGGQLNLALSGRNGQIGQIAPMEAAWPKIVAAFLVALVCTNLHGLPRT